MHSKTFTKTILLGLAASAFLASCASDDKYIPTGASTASRGEHMAKITAVDYRPAPGQFVNLLPASTDKDTQESINQKVLAILNSSNNIISLGAFGGSVTMTLADPIFNNRDTVDFKINGNALTNTSEPGLVEVSKDGKTWYELKGEHWDKSKAHYSVTYYQPTDSATNEHYIKWKTVDGDEGWISRFDTYKQPFFPKWQEPVDSMKFTSRALPNNAVKVGGGVINLTAYWGYVDSYPNNTSKAWLDLDNAVDAAGNSVYLDQIKYIRVTTAILANNGVIGELSTEVGCVTYYKQ